MDVLTIIVGIILSVIYLRRCGEQKKPIRAMVANSLCGMIGLVVAAVVTGFSGCGVAVNGASVLVAAVLGVPGVVMMLVSLFVL